MMITMQVTFRLKILTTFAQRTQSIISGRESNNSVYFLLNLKRQIQEVKTNKCYVE